MTNATTTTDWWTHLTELAGNGHYAEAEQLIAEAEQVTAAARALIAPRAVSPSHARILRFPITPKRG